MATPGRAVHGLSVRVLNYFCHMNSKTFFRYMRGDAQMMREHRPVSVHVKLPCLGKWDRATIVANGGASFPRGSRSVGSRL